MQPETQLIDKPCRAACRARYARDSMALSLVTGRMSPYPGPDLCVKGLCSVCYTGDTCDECIPEWVLALLRAGIHLCPLGYLVPALLCLCYMPTDPQPKSKSHVSEAKATSGAKPSKELVIGTTA